MIPNEFDDVDWKEKVELHSEGVISLEGVEIFIVRSDEKAIFERIWIPFFIFLSKVVFSTEWRSSATYFLFWMKLIILKKVGFFNGKIFKMEINQNQEWKATASLLQHYSKQNTHQLLLLTYSDLVKGGQTQNHLLFEYFDKIPWSLYNETKTSPAVHLNQ